VIRKLWTIVQFVSLDLQSEWNTELPQNHTQKLKKLLTNTKSVKFFKNPYATMYSGVTPQAYNDFACAVKPDVMNRTCNEMVLS
jgi:hypothetical protein